MRPGPQEREADAFAAEFLSPRDSIVHDLPIRADLRRLAQLRQAWGYRSTPCCIGAENSACSPTPRLGVPTSVSTHCVDNQASPANPSLAIPENNPSYSPGPSNWRPPKPNSPRQRSPTNSPGRSDGCENSSASRTNAPKSSSYPDILFDPEDRAQVELQSTTFILPRERDLHAIAARPSGDDRTGLYT